MPLIIDDDLLSGVTPATGKTGPEFTLQSTYHRDLTGSGGRVGRITDSVHPANPDLSYLPVPGREATYTERDGDTAIRVMTTDVLIDTVLTRVIERIAEISDERRQVGPGPKNTAATPDFSNLFRFPVPDTAQMFDVTAHLFTTNSTVLPRMWLNITPQKVVLRNRKVLNDIGEYESDNSTHVLYRTELYVFNDAEHTLPGVDADGNAVLLPSISEIAAVTDIELQHPLRYNDIRSFVHIGYSYDVPAALLSTLSDVGNYIASGSARQLSFDTDAFTAWSKDEYDTYGRLCAQAAVLRTEAVAGPVLDLTEQLYAAEAWKAQHDGTTLAAQTMVPIAHQLRFLEHFDILLEAYSKIYTGLVDIDGQGSITQALIKQNMQLALNGNLSDLSAMRDTLSVPTPPANYQLDPRYSLQQVEAITTVEPLAIIQAGAGTGKSTTILERMKFLTAAGVDPSNITVLSFTNAAADNITAKNPAVVSKTIAKMIHEVYSLNYPKHELSTLDTILNSLDIYYGTQMQTNEFMVVFRKIMARAIHETSNASMTELTSFIERYTTEVIEILDVIKQTSLELEIIIAYLRIADMAEPFASPEYLIIDEVQDNSAMEFVYSLKYAAKHATSLYLVGDSSQTLYEFRAANPKALNALEGSGVFATYRLTTNYRSKQEILDFANIALKSIEANQYAKIQLQANALTEATEKSFTDSVLLLNHHVNNQNQYFEEVDSFIRDPKVKARVATAIAKGEVTTVLAYSRREAAIAMAALQEMFPGVAIANLTNELSYKSTTFSSFISKYWDQVTAVPPANAAFTFTTQLKKNLAAIEKNAAKAEASVVLAMSTWWLENQAHIDGWLHLHQMVPSQLGAEEFFLRLRENIINYEIRNNAVRQSLVNQRNTARKEANAAAKPLLMVSTIHGTKGLEFDHTIVLRKPDPINGSIAEDVKRLYYVALTRAKISEIIITANTKAHPRIVTDYEIVVTALARRDEERALAAAAAMALSPAGVHTVSTSTSEDIGVDVDAENSADLLAADDQSQAPVSPTAVGDGSGVEPDIDTGDEA